MEMSQQLEQARDAAVRPLELAVVLPTYNERGNIASMVARLEQALGPAGWEAIFVAVNSPHGTAGGAPAKAFSPSPPPAPSTSTRASGGARSASSTSAMRCRSQKPGTRRGGPWW